MRKKGNKTIWAIIILIVLLGGIVFLYLNQNKMVNASSASESESSGSTTKITEVTVGTQTIENTLSSSGQISSNLEEVLELNTYRYFKEIYVEENDYVAEGENILKYTNGTYLTAPYNCVITKISVPEASSRCTSQHSITVQSTETFAMTLSIDETEIGKVAVGQEVKIVPNAFEDKTYTGTIAKINQIGNYAANGSNFTATVVFENDGDLKIGMSASASVTIEKAENVVAVPIEAVQTSGGTKYVIVAQADGTTQNVTIETGISNDAYVEVKSGLTGGETIQMTTTTSNSSMGGMMNMQNRWDRNGSSGNKGMMTQGGGAPSGGGSMPNFGM